MIALLLFVACDDIQVRLELDEAAILPVEGGEPVQFPDSAEPYGDSGGELGEDSGGALDDTALPPVDTSEPLDEAILQFSWSARQPTRLRSVNDAVAGQLLWMDVTADANPDLIYLSCSSGGRLQELTIWPGSGSGLGPAASRLVESCYLQVIGGDFTGDGHPDLLASTGSAIHVLTGNGNGFDREEVLDQGRDFSLLGAADLTGDGAPEAIAGAAGETAAIRVYGANGQGVVTTIGAVEGGLGVTVPVGAAPLMLAGAAHAVAILAESRPDIATTRVVEWDAGLRAPVLRELDVVRNGGPGSQITAAYGEDLDGDGESELVTTGATGLFVWNPVRSAVREVRGGDPVQEVVTGLVSVDLEGDGARDALEVLVHAVDATHSELHLQPSMARQGALVLAEPVITLMAPGGPGWLGGVVAGEIDDDACADAVVLDANLDPWLMLGLCRPAAP
ncbi:hypothetical protein LBMAG42_07710 [Deltaproteobacteria bacterium]|nr:hypothetical protein LBMAG42_07710 [Deltaproteobacteria bacterium]